MKFNYQARTQEGQSQAGIIEATSREAALLVLQKYGLYVTFLEETKIPIYSRRINIFQRVSSQDIMVLSRQLAIMFKANVPVVEALHTVAKQSTKQAFRDKLFKIAEKVEGGTPLSQSLAFHPEIFPVFYTSMVKSGEVSGKLSDVLNYLADHLEREHNFYAKLKGAMVYPLFVTGVVAGVFALMIFFVIPQLTQVLKDQEQAIPQVTQTVISMADFLRAWWWMALLVPLAAGVFIFNYFRTREGKKIIDNFVLKLPVFGSFLKKIYLSRLAENLSTLIASGLPIIQSLEIAGEVVGNDVYQSIMLKVQEGAKRGEPISSILTRYPEAFPPMFIQMAVVGERTGQLDSVLMNVVNFYRVDIEQSLEKFIKYLEPILIIFLAGIVLFVIMAVLMPIYQSYNVAG